ncbi:MAG: hypothetical protein QNK37_11340 [Acidobacteriota bacterium]|nr:hypothetical protein [Acidobacteriota bacterium]
MKAFFEQHKDQAFDRLQLRSLCGGDSAAPLEPPFDDDDGGG